MFGINTTRRALGGVASFAGNVSLDALDAVLRSPIAETAVDRVVASPLAEHAVAITLDRVAASPAVERLADQIVQSPRAEYLVARVIDSPLLDGAVARLLESEDLWILVDEIARSPAVTDAISHQGVGLADEVGEVVRQRSRRADERLERIALRLVHRRPRPES